MKTILFITTTVFLGWLPIFTPLLLHAEPAMSKRTSLEKALKEWEQQKNQLTNLRQQLETIDVLSDPDHDERFWWNPLWRSNRENDLQEANRIVLSIQELDIKHQAAGPDLYHACNQYIIWVTKQSKPTLMEDLFFWKQVDTWRFNYSINRIDTKKEARRIAKLSNPELLKNTLSHFESIQNNWKQHLNYLADWDSEIFQTAPKQYKIWQLRFHNKSDALTLLIHQVRQKLKQPPTDTLSDKK